MAHSVHWPDEWLTICAHVKKNLPLNWYWDAIQKCIWFTFKTDLAQPKQQSLAYFARCSTFNVFFSSYTLGFVAHNLAIQSFDVSIYGAKVEELQVPKRCQTFLPITNNIFLSHQCEILAELFMYFMKESTFSPMNSSESSLILHLNMVTRKYV